jgi:hypothetical protein
MMPARHQLQTAEYGKPAFLAVFALSCRPCVHPRTRLAIAGEVKDLNGVVVPAIEGPAVRRERKAVRPNEALVVVDDGVGGSPLVRFSGYSLLSYLPTLWVLPSTSAMGVSRVDSRKQ